MECEEKAMAQWNAFADEYNQWSELGADEKETIILRHLVREFVECYFSRNYRGIKAVVQDACTIFTPNED